MAGMLTCINSEVELSATSDDPNLTYQWTGPIGFTSDLQNPSVNTPGEYTVIATAANGCTSSSAVIVESDDVIPSSIFESINENIVINCINSTATYIGFSDYEGDYTTTWSSPDGTSSNESEITITEGGSYSLIITAENGCSSESILNILEDFLEPDIETTGGIITCVDNLSLIHI